MAAAQSPRESSEDMQARMRRCEEAQARLDRTLAQCRDVSRRMEAQAKAFEARLAGADSAAAHLQDLYAALTARFGPEALRAIEEKLARFQETLDRALHKCLEVGAAAENAESVREELRAWVDQAGTLVEALRGLTEQAEVRRKDLLAAMPQGGPRRADLGRSVTLNPSQSAGGGRPGIREAVADPPMAEGGRGNLERTLAREQIAAREEIKRLEALRRRIDDVRVPCFDRTP